MTYIYKTTSIGFIFISPYINTSSKLSKRDLSDSSSYYFSRAKILRYHLKSSTRHIAEWRRFCPRCPRDRLHVFSSEPVDHRPIPIEMREFYNRRRMYKICSSSTTSKTLLVWTRFVLMSSWSPRLNLAWMCRLTSSTRPLMMARNEGLWKMTWSVKLRKNLLKNS